MCELFAMSSLAPSTVELSLEEFSRHGGLSGPHKDGWGIAWYEDRDVRLIKEALPAATSACVRFVQEHPLRSAMVLGHIRKATRGEVARRNCQPFIRELVASVPLTSEGWVALDEGCVVVIRHGRIESSLAA